jgi:hypothetical protein
MGNLRHKYLFLTVIFLKSYLRKNFPTHKNENINIYDAFSLHLNFSQLLRGYK